MSIQESYPADPELHTGQLFLPGTEALLGILRLDPTTPIPCVFNDGEWAIMIREMPEGCVALPDRTTQPLCQQHEVKRTPMAGDVPVIDLSVGAAWSLHRGIVPRFYITFAGVVEFPQDTPETSWGVAQGDTC